MNRRTFLATAAITASARYLRAAATPKGELPFRQVHLDFHTSELIPGVGEEFNAREFAATLKHARINSINVFAKCHHGWAYYDTKIAHRHPHLKPGLDMLGEMVRACRANGIHVLYYYSLVWDVRVARAHPEWRMLNRDGSVIGGQPGDAWPWLCLNTPYMDQILAENKEILDNYDVDGSWFDILKQPPDGCWCRWCREDRQSLKLSDSHEDVVKHNKIVALRVENRLFEQTRTRFKDGLTFFNSRLVVGVRDELDYYSHIEIESLPTGGWGYSHFQQRVRYMRTLGKDMVGMTGRFHKSWGDFGGLKNQAALDFECLNFLANGTKCCVGDQLHPGGRLEPATYDRIGKTYAKVEALEPWCSGARAVADVGVVSTAIYNMESTQKIAPSDQGFTNMLVELHQQFNVLDLEEDFSRYKVLILPDEIRPSAKLAAKLDAFAAAGGAVIVTGESLLDPQSGQFGWKAMDGLRAAAPKSKAEFFVPDRNALPSLEDYSWFLYQSGLALTASTGWQPLAWYAHPYFDRSAEKFSSHKQTPPAGRTSDPFIVRKGRVAYIANPVFRSYALDGTGAYKLLVKDLLAAFLPQPVVVAPALPSTAQTTLLEQPARKRFIVHLLHYPMTRRAPDIDIIEEPAWLVEQEVRLRTPKAPARVMAVPQQAKLDFRFESGYTICKVAQALGHQAICFEME